MMTKRLYNLLFPSLILVSFLGCSNNNNFVHTEGMIWNTIYHITYSGPETLIDSIHPVLNSIEKSLSVFDKNSLVSKLNDSNQIKVDSHFQKVYDKAKEINQLSDGRFDPTLSPLIDAWGFGVGHKVSKDTLKIDSILEFVGINKTQRIEDIIIKEDKRTRFNFSAIAKGYGCDAVGQMFKRNGVNNYMVEIGGEISLSGHSPSGNNWKIAVDAPIENNNPGDESALILSLSDVGIATSGNYRNFRIEGNKKYAHTISPRTGKPFEGEILSATIIAPSCMEADAIATACMASTFSEAKDLINKCDLEGMLILSDSIWLSPDFKKYIVP